ncbi:hypothetical protein HID58_041542 [Brassica napus]|uniref:Uncharacterized protein n=1 Tax=Brassica napus TaxID=3708 RepID=A0ABQ8BB54_BRANA|nr:hypothetical protein HID58_041542 [Brassica napus]
MGQDYSYTQPSSSDEYDLTSLLEAEAALYAEEAESSYNIVEPEQLRRIVEEYLTCRLSLRFDRILNVITLAAKAASKKKKSGKEEELSRLQTIMEIKQKLSNQKLLDRLLAKKVPLTEMETSLKLKLMSDMFSSKSEASPGAFGVICHHLHPMKSMKD